MYHRLRLHSVKQVLRAWKKKSVQHAKCVSVCAPVDDNSPTSCVANTQTNGIFTNNPTISNPTNHLLLIHARQLCVVTSRHFSTNALLEAYRTVQRTGEVLTSNRVFIKGPGLNVDLTFLKEFFGRFGEVESVNVPQLHKYHTEGFRHAYVTFRSQVGVDNALRAGSVRDRFQRKILIEKVKRAQIGNQVYLSGLDMTCDGQELQELLATFGPVQKVIVPKRSLDHYQRLQELKQSPNRYAFVTFTTEEAARVASKQQQLDMGDSCLVEVNLATDGSETPEATIHVKGFGTKFTPAFVRSVFNRFGAITQVSLHTKYQGDSSKGSYQTARVVFKESKAAKEAIAVGTIEPDSGGTIKIVEFVGDTSPVKIYQSTVGMSSSAGTPPDTQVYFAMISNEIDHDNLKSVFERELGAVATINIPKLQLYKKYPEEGRKYGFVYFATKELAQKALELGALTYMNGRELTFGTTDWQAGSASARAKHAEQTDQTDIFVKGFSSGTTEEQLHQYFSRFGVVEGVYVRHLQMYGFPSRARVKFQSKDSVQAVAQHSDLSIDGHPIMVNTHTHRNSGYTIFADNLPTDATCESVADYFRQFGTVQLVYMIFRDYVGRNSHTPNINFAYVTFNRAHAINLHELYANHGMHSWKDRRMRVKLSERKRSDTQKFLTKLMVEGLGGATEEQVAAHFNEMAPVTYCVVKRLDPAAGYQSTSHSTSQRPAARTSQPTGQPTSQPTSQPTLQPTSVAYIGFETEEEADFVSKQAHSFQGSFLCVRRLGIYIEDEDKETAGNTAENTKPLPL